MMVVRQGQQYQTLQALLKGFCDEVADTEILLNGLCLDSRECQPGDVFIATSGTQQHGLMYAEMALAKGANAIVYEVLSDQADAELQAKLDDLYRRQLPLFAVQNLRKHLGEIAARFYHNPSADMSVTGITGTNGKTSCAHFLASILSDEFAHQQLAPCGVIGTLGNGLYGQLTTATHTTPDAITLQHLFSDMRAQSVTDVVMEVSSHALHQFRISGINFDTAVFTNLSHEHLDYHGDMQSYGDTKRQLFLMPGLRYAVINADDDFGRHLLDSLPEQVRVIAYSLDPQTATEIDAGHQSNLMYLGCVHATGLQLNIRGIELSLNTPWGEAELHSQLLGRFNASNLLAVASVLLLKGLAIDKVAKALGGLQAIPGRMQAFHAKQQPMVVVDYAHTPDALEQALQSLKQHCEGGIHCVFGCGGDRDKGKRPMMGGIAQQYCRSITLTNDNPRTEDPNAIIDDILGGITDQQNVHIETDRLTAIRATLARATADDVVLVAGKGHENYQLIGNRRLPFSDIDTVSGILREVAR